MKFKIKTNLVTGIVMGLISLALLLLVPSQIREPAFDSGAPSPRLIPTLCITVMLISSIALLVQSLILKKRRSWSLTGRRRSRLSC